MSDENDYHFIDTNVLVYAYDTTAGSKHKRAQDLLN
jgi:predicted nucleic acid-binding protein